MKRNTKIALAISIYIGIIAVLIGFFWFLVIHFFELKVLLLTPGRQSKASFQLIILMISYQCWNILLLIKENLFRVC